MTRNTVVTEPADESALGKLAAGAGTAMPSRVL